MDIDIETVLNSNMSDDEIRNWVRGNGSQKSVATSTPPVAPATTPQAKPTTAEELKTLTPYKANVTPFGEYRQPTGLENLLGIDPNKITDMRKQMALGQDANGVFTPRGDFETAHGFNIGDYLKQAVAEKERGDYSLNQEGVFDKINKFFTAPLDEAKATEQAYATNAFDNKIQNLIDDIVMYNSFQKQLSEANANNTMPKVRADIGTTDGPDSRQLNRLLFGSGYKGPESRDWMNTYNHVYDTLSDMGKNERKAVEKDIYRRLAEINRPPK